MKIFLKKYDVSIDFWTMFLIKSLGSGTPPPKPLQMHTSKYFLNFREKFEKSFIFFGKNRKFYMKRSKIGLKCNFSLVFIIMINFHKFKFVFNYKCVFGIINLGFIRSSSRLLPTCNSYPHLPTTWHLYHLVSSSQPATELSTVQTSVPRVSETTGVFFCI